MLQTYAGCVIRPITFYDREIDDRRGISNYIGPVAVRTRSGCGSVAAAEAYPWRRVSDGIATLRYDDSFYDRDRRVLIVSDFLEHKNQ